MSEKLSTEEILAAIRSGAASAEESAPAEQSVSSPDVTAESESPPAEKVSAPAADGPAPTETSAILDSIRSAGTGATVKPAADHSEDTRADRPAAGLTPKNTGDILAAVRGGGAAAPVPPKQPAASAPAPDIDVGAVSGLSVSEMIQAARAGRSPEEADVKPVVLPSKPLGSRHVTKPLAKTSDSVQRRGFLRDFVAWITTPIVLAWTLFCATLGVASLATARFMMPNVLVEPPTKFKVGPLTDYSPGTVSTKWKAQFGVWIVNAEVEGMPMVYALSTVCTHLGCTPNWLDGEQKFKCPCHGSGFRMTGVNFEGPAPRPLERMGIRLAPDGMLEVDKSVKFQQELGQWENGASYVPVV